MRTIRIDAVSRRVQEVEEPNHGLSTIQAYVGGYIAVGARLANGDVIYVDDEALLKRPEHFFTIKGYPLNQLCLAGNGYVVGTVPETGDDAHACTPLAWFRRNIVFLDLATVQTILSLQGEHHAHTN